MSVLTKVPFLSNLECETALPWNDLIDKLEIGLERFSKGEVEQPVRVMLPIQQHSGFLGKTIYRFRYNYTTRDHISGLYPLEFFVSEPFLHNIMLRLWP